MSTHTPYRIPLAAVPHAFNSLREVEEWHMRHVILDSYSHAEARQRLDMSNTLYYTRRREYGIEDLPWGTRGTTGPGSDYDARAHAAHIERALLAEARRPRPPMPRFRKKPVEIEAVRFTGENHDEIVRFAGLDAKVIGRTNELHIQTKEGMLHASPGDWIIRGVAGEHYPCKPDIFEATYEPAE